MPNVSMSIRTVTKMKIVAPRRGLSAIVNQRKPELHGPVDARPIVRREQIEQKPAEAGDQQRGQGARASAGPARQPRAHLEGLEPFVDGRIEEPGKTRGVTQRESVDFKGKPSERLPLGFAPFAPQGARDRARRKIGELEIHHHRSLPSAAAPYDLDNQLLLRSKVVEQAPRARSDGPGERPKRELGQTVAADVIDRTVEQLRAVRFVGGSRHALE